MRPPAGLIVRLSLAACRVVKRLAYDFVSLPSLRDGAPTRVALRQGGASLRRLLA